MKSVLMISSWSSLCLAMALAILSVVALPDSVFASGPTCDECDSLCGGQCAHAPDPPTCYQQCMTSCNPLCGPWKYICYYCTVAKNCNDYSWGCACSFPTQSCVKYSDNSGCHCDP
jgi:hypothetical protein